jgi:hypothetical protein
LGQLIVAELMLGETMMPLGVTHGVLHNKVLKVCIDPKALEVVAQKDEIFYLISAYCITKPLIWSG